MRLPTIIGLASTTLALGFWMMPTIGNNDLFPETRVCFRPKTVNNPKNEYLMRCDSNERTGVILTSVFKQLDKKDIEFHNKISTDSITKHFDNNLPQTQLSQVVAMLCGCIGLGSFSYSESLMKEEKNKRYHKKRKEILINEATVNQELYPSDPVAVIQGNQLAKEQHIRDITRIQKEAILDDLEIVKATKEIEKRLKSKTNASTTECSKKELTESLIEALKSHEDGWLWKILKMRKPTWIIGGQGSGKSTLAAFLVMLRYYLFGWSLKEIVDVHGQKNAAKAWKNLLELGEEKATLTGSRNDYNAINTTFLEAIERWNDKTEDSTPVQTLVDEFTNLSDADECKDTVAKFFKFSLSDIRKTGERWIFIAHYFTATATGKSEGTHRAKTTQTIQIEKFTENGETPLSNVSVSGMSDEKGKPTEEIDYTIPVWLNPEAIHGHFNGSPILFD